MSAPYLGSIILFAGNFAPRGWALCDGQLLPISQNTALFSLLGTTYGGNGQTTFALPDLRGRAALHAGQGPGLSNYALGQNGGAETITLGTNQLPAHQHAQPATNALKTRGLPPADAFPAKGGAYAPASDGHTLAPTTAAGGGQPHSNVQPYLTLNYIIALQGIYPSRN